MPLRGIALAISGHVHRGRVGESKEALDATLVGCFQKPLLPGLFGPVVSPIGPLEALTPAPGIPDVRVRSLLRSTGAKVEPPDGEPDEQLESTQTTMVTVRPPSWLTGIPKTEKTAPPNAVEGAVVGEDVVVEQAVAEERLEGDQQLTLVVVIGEPGEDPGMGSPGCYHFQRRRLCRSCRLRACRTWTDSGELWPQGRDRSTAQCQRQPTGL